ncbi:EFR1 family ferrodoxin [Roseburia sp. 499]|uniref:EFR1 family ferrodoxin n=1 Tax=Roseburia sp. 499 TaxID=1261634 RepID=UPI000951809C|nr:EFR1 family ferrodoxin [Roseburia sp. 499]WVK69372.1 EFR1 family ferrodoxin [Roseburia sp. 499]
MIFYFSGTGNSQYVAKAIGDATNDITINITKSEINKNTEYILREGENLGFVFPIYWWGMPMLVEEFVRKMKIKVKDNNYIYGVSTYGLEAHNGLKDLEKLLLKKDMYLDATYEVKMVDNYVVGYDIAGKEKQEEICQKARAKTEKIIHDIEEQKQTKIGDIIGTTIKPIVHKAYKCTDHRKKFYVTEECTGCGYCEKNCPCQAIVMENNKPVWKENCSFCLKCIHSCPRQAVQHGKGTIKRSRYVFGENLEKFIS